MLLVCCRTGVRVRWRHSASSSGEILFMALSSLKPNLSRHPSITHYLRLLFIQRGWSLSHLPPSERRGTSKLPGRHTSDTWRQTTIHTSANLEALINLNYSLRQEGGAPAESD